MEKSPPPDSNKPPSPTGGFVIGPHMEIARPDQLPMPEVDGPPTEIFPSLGTVAMASQVESDVMQTSQHGFIGRRWQSLKDTFQGLNLRENPAAQAITEAGGTLSKWDVAKATVQQFAAAGPQLGNVLVRGFAEPFKGAYSIRQVAKRAEQRATRFGTGVANPTLRKKMAEVLVSDGVKSRDNPVYNYLQDHDWAAGRRQVSEFGLRHEVERKAERIKRRQVTKEKMAIPKATAYMLGTIAVTSAADLFIK